MDIIESKKYGLANTINNIIYIHPILNDFQDIKAKVINHELKHKHTKGFWKQREIDARTEIKFKDLLPVYKKKPSLFLKQYSPITYINKTLYVEWSLIILYIIYGSIAYSIFTLIKLFSSNQTMFWLIIKWGVGIGFASFALYMIGKRLRKSINEQAEKLIPSK